MPSVPPPSDEPPEVEVEPESAVVGSLWETALVTGSVAVSTVAVVAPARSVASGTPESCALALGAAAPAAHAAATEATTSRDFSDRAIK